MHLLFLSHYFPPEGNAPARRVYEMTRRWVKAGHEVTVITCAPNVPNGVVYDGYRNRFRQVEVVEGVQVVRVWTYLAPNRGTVRRTLNYLSYMVSAVLASFSVKRPDVLIATSPQFFCGWAGVLASRLRRVPFILEIRDIWPESIAAVGAIRRPAIIRFLERLERRLYAAARQIVAVGDGYKARLVERGVAPEKVTVISNGVDLATFAPRPPSAEVRERFGLAGRFVCAYVGTIGMASGLGVVLRAADLLKKKGQADIVFLLVGDGAVRSDLEWEARALGLDNVVFAGRLDMQMIPEVLSACDACLVHLKKQPLFTTVLPSKIFEAAAMGKPVVLGVEGEAAALVESAGAGLCIEPENEAALVAAVERLAADPALSERLGRGGLVGISRRFDCDTLAAKYLQSVEVVAASGSDRVVRDEHRDR
ncbi:MAG: glycosyltransferase family 4 protein [Kiritimatiellae bacterium]|nr:glycosyltransferase family 4 protein [Kiritimatiellia bacterium]